MLKTTNYVIENKKQILPIAYGAITKLNLNGHIADVIISIQSSRENCELVRKGELDALHTISVIVPIENYEEHIFTTIYEYIKSETQKEKWDGTIQLEKQPFFGWEDDKI